MSETDCADEFPHMATIHGPQRTAAGMATRVYLERLDGAPMGFTELYDAFQRHFPGKTAVQFLPKPEHFMDQVNKYHLLVFDVAPAGFDLFRSRE